MPKVSSLRPSVTATSFVVLGTLVLALGLLQHRWAAPVHRAASQPRVADTGAGSDAGKVRMAEAYGKLPMSFEANVGQVATPAQFLARGPGYAVALEPTQAVLALRSAAKPSTGQATPDRPGIEPVPASPENTTTTRLALQFVGANPAAAVAGESQLPGIVNYFIGSDPAQWHSNVKTFGQVRYRDLYPGIDLVYYGNPQQLEHDFIVAPGADPSTIRLRFDGATGVALADNGDLAAAVDGREVRLQAPVVYQENGAVRQPVQGRYALDQEGAVRFALGEYDRTRTLVIDPVLVYSTYLGGSAHDYGRGIAVDSTGAAYVTGDTQSANFPTTNALQAAKAGFQDVFVAKLASDGSALVYSTYLGGGAIEYGLGIAVDSVGAAYVTGQTSSTNFPTVNALQGALAGSSDVFVAKIAPDGSALLYATYLGGDSVDVGRGIAVDGAGAAYVTGQTYSTNFPTVNALQGANAGSGDAFIARLATDGSALVFGTYLGGSGSDNGNGVAVDSIGAAYVAGGTDSANFPTTNALQGARAGSEDAFVVKVVAGGSALVYATYIGGSATDRAYGIALDSVGAAYVTGITGSTNFPTANALQGASAGSSEVFVTKLAADGSALGYSTYLGGGSGDVGYGIAVDSVGAAYVTGETVSTNFPTVNALQAAFAGSIDSFVAKLAAGGSALVYSTYLGGGAMSMDLAFRWTALVLRMSRAKQHRQVFQPRMPSK